MRNITRSIEIKDSHILEMAMKQFGKDHGIDRQAAKLGCSGNVLRNKLNPDQEFHKLTLNEAVLLAGNTGDMSILRAALKQLDHDVHSLESTASESRIIHQVLMAVGAAGNVATIFDRANEDQIIDEEETKELNSAIDNSIKVLSELRASLKKNAA